MLHLLRISASLVIVGFLIHFFPGKPRVGISAKVFDASTSLPLSARIVIQNDSGNVVESYYEHLPGFFTGEDGSFHQALPPGKYRMSVFHGIDYHSVSVPLEITASKGLDTIIHLQPWSNLKLNGWICGDGHNHLDSEKKNNEELLHTIRRVCRAQGIDFLCGVQQWAGYSDSTWKSGYATVSDSAFLLHYGAEMPKYRTGHTWWIGLKSTRGYFNYSIDSNYEERYYQDKQRTSWDFANLPLASIPDADFVRGFKDAENAVAIMAHPTAWWWQKRGEIEKYTTNAAACLPFGLLSGKVWEGMVVMGYKRDNYFYQNLWFGVLNAGYRMPAISELDGEFKRSDRAYVGSMRTYYQTGGRIAMDGVIDALRQGKTFVSSGPIIQADVDDKYGIGNVVTSDGKPHHLNFHVFASGESDDFLSYVIIYRNGKIFKLWDIRKKNLREFHQQVQIRETGKAWFVIKAYGKNAWPDARYLEIAEVCKNKTDYPGFNTDQNQNSVAFTSPVYFWPAGSHDPGVMQSDIDVSVVRGAGDDEIENLKIEILRNGRLLKSVPTVKNRARFTMPVDCWLKISCSNHPPIYRSLYLDYPPHANLVAELASGKWLEKYPAGEYNGGEIPWEAYNYEKARVALSKVKWTIEMVPNERDGRWQHFEAALK